MNIRNMFGVITGPVPVTVINNNGQAIRERVEFILCLPSLKTDPNNTFRPIKAARINFSYELPNTDGTNLWRYNQRGGHQVLVCEARNTANGVLQAEIGKRKLEMGKVHEGCQQIRSEMIDSLTDLLQLEFGCGLVEPTLSIEFLDRVPEERSQFMLTGLIILLGLLMLTAITSLLFSEDRKVETNPLPIIENPIPESQPLPETRPPAATTSSNGNGNGYKEPKNEVPSQPPFSSKSFAWLPPKTKDAEFVYFEIKALDDKEMKGVLFTSHGPIYYEVYRDVSPLGIVLMKSDFIPKAMASINVADSVQYDLGLSIKFWSKGNAPVKLEWDDDRRFKVTNDPLGGGRYPIYEGKRSVIGM